MAASKCLNVLNTFLSPCPSRPSGRSYLFFTQFKTELKGAKVEYASAYVSEERLHPMQIFSPLLRRISFSGEPPMRAFHGKCFECSRILAFNVAQLNAVIWKHSSNSITLYLDMCIKKLEALFSSTLSAGHTAEDGTITVSFWVLINLFMNVTLFSFGQVEGFLRLLY